MELNRGDSKGKRYFGDISRQPLRFRRLSRPIIRDNRRQEYLPRLRPPAEGTDGTDAVRFDCSANCPRSEMTFERVGPSWYPPKPFSVLLEQSALLADPGTKSRPKICIARFRRSLKFTLKSARRRSASSQARLAIWGMANKPME